MDLSQEMWRKKQVQTDGSMIVDVRTLNEYKMGYIENSQLLDIQEPQIFMDELKTFDKSKTYFLYCRSGARSAQACQIFKQNGISNCFNLLGGILDWHGELKK
jgi:rhodanese-related sulfurtransferase